MDLTEIKKYFQIKDNAPFFVRSFHNKFVVTHITIKKIISSEDEKLKVILYYQIIANDKELVHRFSTTFNSMDAVIDKVYHTLWTCDLCPECFAIMESGKSFCDACYPQKYFWDYGILKQKAESIPTCSICFENTISNRLECGHYFHVTCFSKFFSKKNVKCPLCRKPITESDRLLFSLD